ncbi:unnamed protein product [Cylicocyclus nassatus]|uniref:Peptidase C1A papain C-terminal domain-containing protein n=1 Tax=Cylicocyclus nassatus TaxID=53992 RepID=A0AA36GMK4_CYLNA|nr:unnamed protein product [Cylicocyclus nassatus]
MIVPCIVLAAVGAMAVEPSSFYQQSMQEFVDYINSAQSLFKAGVPTKGFKPRFMDPKYLELNKKTLLRKVPVVLAAEQNITIPPRFDAREMWSNCKSIRLVRDQGNCGSCWAVAATSVMSDRLCIASGQRIQTLLSATDLLSCCKDCRKNGGDPCEGGEREEAWIYLNTHGICSGGPYNRTTGCKPYMFPPCDHVSIDMDLGHNFCKDKETLPVPECAEECLKGYGKTYAEDRVHGFGYEVDTDEEEIQKEIMTRGPVQATFIVYADFGIYKSGIYKRVLDRKNKRLAPHTVKIIGWGVENMNGRDVKYWLISNSWGPRWGENGFFRMIRGENHCLIESEVVAGQMIP